MARLIFLGTAGSSSVVSKQFRSSGGIIIQVDELQFHIDPGPGAVAQARKYGVSLHQNTAVLISHHHINHCNDINIVVDAMTHSGIEQRGVILGSKSALQPEGDHHPILTEYHQGLVERIIPLEKNHKVGIELVEINALPAEHTDETAIGFKFFCPKLTISYTGDTKLTAPLLESLVGSDILILNVPYPGNKAEGMNLDTESAIAIISHVRPKMAFLTHFGLDMLKADPLVEAREVQRITGIQTVAASDGLSISTKQGSVHPVRGYS